MTIKYIYLIAVVCLFSCKAQKEGHSPVGERLEHMELVDFDNHSNIAYYENTIITDNKSLRKYYSQINKTRKPGLPLPILDFSSEMAIIICLGEQNNVRKPVLSKLKESDQAITIAVELIAEEKEDKIGKQPITYPFYLYKMPLVDKAVVFQKIDN
ncbi:hypothetical protein LCL86_12435 [Muricauda ruestringensis]|uniref:Protease complex subunit PrcB family protein n=1 Tax=Flagellimonas marinaquae TaxID=254955 RepID=A0AA48I136_9FLAO|nr:hypothetical protein [Allomuricauda ruestringensis]MCA0959859.1 hypothetical protein [Allomuricauda ruestringensis]BDW93796.1 hypothetical protein MACH07_26280 [Allomuricauda aquimarina]